MLGISSSYPMPDTSSSHPSELDEAALLSSLKDLVVAGDHRLDPILAAIADAAQSQTGASGAALAMWKDGAMVCRARSGATAPALGARLNAEAGISGECLRTGKVQHCRDTENDPLVDVEVCRSLGLRSIAVLPIQGWRGINGILEIFSTEPATFTEQHLAFLQQLAALAERARASQPHGASAAATSVRVEQPQPSGLLPASDRVSDVAAVFLSRRSRPFILGAAGLLAFLLLGFVIWLGWRGPKQTSGKAKAASPSPLIAQRALSRPPDNDPVWKSNPGGEALLPGKTSAGIPFGTSAGTPVTLASEVEVVAGPKTRPDQSLLAEDSTRYVSIPRELPAAGAEETSVADPPPIPATDANSSALNGVLASPLSMPGLSPTAVSQGASSGRLVRRVSPSYPAQALLLRLQGKVILDAMILEDGTVHDIKVAEGHPVLARSAVEAVQRWRYKPYELNGKPVKTRTTITVDFKLPSETPAR